MTIIQSNPIYDEDERGLPIRTPYTRYKVKCDICKRQVELISEEGVFSETLAQHGMDTWLRPEGRGHVCAVHGPPALREEAAIRERAKIVEWLKSLATPENGFLPRTLANWIEDEMHYEDHQI